MTTCDVAIIGAGPYGLSAAATLRTIKGLEVRVFGEPMSFWDQNMPVGMFLRSAWTATHIADPNSLLTLEAFQAATNRHFFTPVPLDEFVQYGLWYQRQAAPDVDRRRVIRVETDPAGFRLHLDDGEALGSRRVVIAAGIGSFAQRPPEFDHLPRALATHTSEHWDLQKFAGKRVLVVGGGQSALESGALLHEAHAEVEIVSKASRIHWLQGWASKTLHYRSGKFIKELLYAPTASNLHADILSDLGSAIAGSLGLAGSANLNPERRFPSMFEPVHGSAPDIAGRGISNPIGAIASGALMLDHLGWPEDARRVEAAIEVTTAAGHLTRDVGGTAGTAEVTDAIIEALRAGAVTS